jgi:hypothetical protein
MPKTIEFRLASVYPSWFTESPELLPEDENPLISYRFELDLEWKSEEQQVQLTLRLMAQLSLPESEGGIDEHSIDSNLALQPLVATQISCIFDFRGLEHARNEANEVQLPQLVVASLIGITLSTARGYLIGRSRQSLFADTPMPILNPQNILMDILQQKKIPWIAEA